MIEDARLAKMQLFLKAHFRSIRKQNLVEELPIDPLELVEHSGCSIKPLPCVKRQYENCSGKDLVIDMKVMESL